MSEAVDLSRKYGVTVSETAKMMGVSHTILSSWVTKRPNLLQAAFEFTQRAIAKNGRKDPFPQSEAYRGYMLSRQEGKKYYIFKSGLPIDKTKMSLSEAKQAVDSRL